MDTQFHLTGIKKYFNSYSQVEWIVWRLHKKASLFAGVVLQIMVLKISSYESNMKEF